jgi:catechol-2,3-dioxygenase
MKTHSLSHVAMSVPPGTLTDAYRKEVLDFYGDLLGWREMEDLRLPDRLTIAVGRGCYVNVRERDDAMTATGYEHFGVLVRSADDLAHVTKELQTKHPDVAVTPQSTTEGGHHTIRFQHLLPLAVEVQYFPDITPPA